MSLKHALLGFLSYGGTTGYQLKENFDNSIAHFWQANLSQIYPTLKEMEREGLLTMEVEYQESRPNRKVYQITDQGREELRRWLRLPTNLASVHEPFLIKVFFGAELSQDEILAQLRSQLELHRGQRDAYATMEATASGRSAAAASLVRESVFWNLTLQMGIKSEEAWIAWLEEAIREIEALGENSEQTTRE
jgi:DNA-binding PadR family transcriptional regulator